MKRPLTAVASMALALALSLGAASAAVAAPPSKPAKGSMAEKDSLFNSYLDQLVAKGTITAAQAEAIAAAMKEKRAERQAKMEKFSQRADAAIAAILGITKEKFCELRASRALPALTHEQRAAIRTKLNEIAVALGLPKAPPAKGK